MVRKILAAAALAVGTAVGWFAAGAWGTAAGRGQPALPDGQCDDGRAACSHAAAAAGKPRRTALIRSSADAGVKKRMLENEIRYLEKCVAAAKKSVAKPAVKNSETHAGLLERLRKLPTEGERLTAVQHLDDGTPITVGDMKKLCPEWAKRQILDEETHLKCLDNYTKIAVKRIGILDAFDLSGLNDEERKVHFDLMETVAEFPDVYADMLVQFDSTTMDEFIGRIRKIRSNYKRSVELETRERAMLVVQMIKRFEIPDGEAAELRATWDEVRRVTSPGYFMNYKKKD